MNSKIEKITNCKGKRKITALTAYDYTFAKILDDNGVDIILVGDSLGMVFCGEADTRNVTVEQIAYHTRSAARGVTNALLVSDMPAGSYDEKEKAVLNAKKLLDAGADAVKIENVGGNIFSIITAITDSGIPVMGHVGLTPQIAEKFHVVGKTAEEGRKIIEDSLKFEENGVFSVVLEAIPSPLASEITKSVSVPTIGIGAGAECDGQILVSYDMLGLFKDFKPKFVRCFVDGYSLFSDAVKKYRKEVVNGAFPSENESYGV